MGSHEKQPFWPILYCYVSTLFAWTFCNKYVVSLTAIGIKFKKYGPKKKTISVPKTVSFKVLVILPTLLIINKQGIWFFSHIS